MGFLTGIVVLMAAVTLTLVRAEDGVVCQPLWTRFENNCYRFFGPAKNWSRAEEHCQEFFSRYGQGHLVSIHSQVENNFVLQLRETSISSPTEHVWVGFHEVRPEEVEGDTGPTESILVRDVYDNEANMEQHQPRVTPTEEWPQWTWTDGTPFDFTQWVPGEPSGNGGLGQIFHSRRQKFIGWDDVGPHWNFPYICKIPIAP
ncbi:echinoidin-like [Asterias amurensis]|uniref:echinoidin-like n=1 Tax=Asterias amurensis TaxID=7602 RepID=UPI003AB31071